MTNAIATTQQNVDTQFAQQIKMLLPYGGKLTDNNALALAGYSRLHGLDPFNGECYYLVRERTDDHGVTKREELGVYPGIKGKRKLSKKQLQDIDPSASYSINYFPVGPEIVGYKAQADRIAVVIQAELRDTLSTEKYIHQTLELKNSGLTFEEIKSIIGKPPVWVGFGIVKVSELQYIKMSPITLAKKRAESDATNQRFDLPFADDTIAEDISPDIEDVESLVTDEEPEKFELPGNLLVADDEEIKATIKQNPPVPEEPKYTAEEAIAQLGF